MKSGDYLRNDTAVSLVMALQELPLQLCLFLVVSMVILDLSLFEGIANEKIILAFFMHNKPFLHYKQIKPIINLT